MSGKNTEIEAFAQLMGKAGKGHVKVQTCWAVAGDINWDEKTMSGKGVKDDLEFFDIQLGLGAFARKPKAGSMCLIGLIENQDAAAFLIDADEVEEYHLNIDNCSFKIDLNGFEMRKGAETLKKILTEFADQMLKIYAPKDVAGITAIKTRINDFLQ